MKKLELVENEKDLTTTEEVLEVESEEVTEEEGEVLETIIIDEEDVIQDVEVEEVKEVKKEVPKKNAKSKRDFVKEVKELSEEETEKMEKVLENDEEVKTKTVDLLTRFKEYISGNKFNDKCKDAGDKYNLNGAAVKNLFVKNTLGTIADILNLTVSIVGDVILGASNFINIIICNIATYASKTLHKIINIITLHCGEKGLC